MQTCNNLNKECNFRCGNSCIANQQSFEACKNNCNESCEKDSNNCSGTCNDSETTKTVKKFMQLG